VISSKGFAGKFSQARRSQRTEDRGQKTEDGNTASVLCLLSSVLFFLKVGLRPAGFWGMVGGGDGLATERDKGTRMLRHWQAVGAVGILLFFAGCASSSRPFFGRFRGDACPNCAAPVPGGPMTEGPVISDGAPFGAPAGSMIVPGPAGPAAPPPGTILPPVNTPPLNPPVGPPPRAVPTPTTNPTKNTT